MGRVLTEIQRKAPEANIKILAVLDLRDSSSPRDIFNVGSVNYPLRSVEHRSVVFYPTKPHEWRFEDIERIDPVDWRPIPKQNVGRQLWKVDKFIHETCLQSNAIRIGHYITGNGGHFRFFFVTRRIVGIFRDSIVSRIRSEIEDILAKKTDSRLSHILYPSDSKGVDEVARLLSIHYAGVRCEPIHRGGRPQTYTKKKCETDVIAILDNACSSGGTIQYILDIAASMGATLIPVFVLMSRASEERWRFFSRITGYDGHEVIVHALTRIPLPAYRSEHECPLCSRKKDLRKLAISRKYPSLTNTINGEIDRLKEENIDVFTYEENSKESIGLDDVVKFRLALQDPNADLGALAELDLIANNPTNYTNKTKFAIVEAIADEATVLFSPGCTVPSDVREALGQLAVSLGVEKEGKNPDKLRQLWQLIVGVTPELVNVALEEFILDNSSLLKNLKVILLEVVLYVERERETNNALYDTCALIGNLHHRLQQVAHEKKVDRESLHLLSETRRGMERETKLRKIDKNSPLENVAELQRLCRRQNPSKHIYIGECLTRISMISSVKTIVSVLDEQYYKEGSLRDLLLGEVLPRVEACRGIFETIGNADYLIANSNPSLSKDASHLDSSLATLPRNANVQNSNEDIFLRAFHSDESRSARHRLLEWIGKEEGLLLEILILLC